MKVNITKKIGQTTYVFQVEEEKDLDALSLAGSIGSMPEKCGHCGSEDVRLTSNKNSGFTFVKVVCDKCNYQSNLGQFKDGGFFWKQWEENQFTPKEEKDVPGIGKEDIPENFI